MTFVASTCLHDSWHPPTTGQHYGGTDDEHNDTFSHMNLGHGMIPNKEPQRIKPYTKPKKAPAQRTLYGSGYMAHLKKAHPTYPQSTGGRAHGTMVYPGKTVVRPETLDVGTYDNRYKATDTMLAARRTAPAEDQDGLQVGFPGYRSAKPAHGYELKFTAQLHRLHEGDQRGGQDQHNLLQ